MLQRRLGAQGPLVSALGFGCLSFGGIFGPTTTEDSLSALDAAWEAGITLFDTANIYGNGVSETVLGQWLARTGHRPHIATKAAFDRRDGSCSGSTTHHSICGPNWKARSGAWGWITSPCSTPIATRRRCRRKSWPARCKGYAGDFQMNVQNQWNLGDWGCFSKYYVTFPLDALPANQGIVSATLRMYHFGNSLPSEAEPSLIQVFTVDEEWNESTLVWNNAPMAVENVARTWVNPIPAGGTGQYVTWDLSRAVAEAYVNGQPLRLALYTADSARHSGKYLNSSETFSLDRRPTLEVTYGSTYGFTVSSGALVKEADPGGSAPFQLTVTPMGRFNTAVTFQSGTIPSGVNVTIPGGGVTPPGSKTITISHTNSSQTAGGLYAVPITVSGDGIQKTITLYLLVNGSQTYLTIIQR